MRVPLGWCETNSIGLNQHGSAPGEWDTVGVKKQKSIRNTKHFKQLTRLPLRGRIFLKFIRAAKNFTGHNF
jgi:hypothetical protein